MEVATPRRTYSPTGMDCLERALPHKGTIQLLFRGHCLAWFPGLAVSPSSGPDGGPGAVSLNPNQLRQRWRCPAYAPATTEHRPLWPAEHRAGTLSRQRVISANIGYRVRRKSLFLSEKRRFFRKARPKLVCGRPNWSFSHHQAVSCQWTPVSRQFTQLCAHARSFAASIASSSALSSSLMMVTSV